MTDSANAPVEKVSQDNMLAQFQTRLKSLVEENQQLAAKIKENEVVALKLQGAMEALEYYGAKAPEPESGTVDNLVTDESPGETTEK